MTVIQFRRFFSTDSAKAIKGQSFGYLNAINYMSPHTAGGVGNLCSHASPGCIALCLGLHSGQAAMRKEGQDNLVTLSRKRKAQYFMHSRQAFMCEMAIHIAKEYRQSRKMGLKLVIRPNGSTDIAYEGIRFDVDAELANEIRAITGMIVPMGRLTIFELFSFVQFVDYTKNHYRFGRVLPVNYSLTFSRSEINDAKAIELLNRGVNVAVVFSKTLPATWNGFTVINGDEHDLRHLDPRAARGFVIGLLPKGNKAKKETIGFVVRNAANASAAHATPQCNSRDYAAAA